MTAAANATAEAAPAAEKPAEAPKSQPGFEGIFAIACLLTLVGLVLGRRTVNK